MKYNVMALCLASFLLMSNSANSQGIAAGIIDLNAQCGPLSGKTPDQLPEEQRHQCEEYAARANEALHLPGPGFALSPEYIAKAQEIQRLKELNDKIFKAVSAHDCATLAYLMTRHISNTDAYAQNCCPKKERFKWTECENFSE